MQLFIDEQSSISQTKYTWFQSNNIECKLVERYTFEYLVIEFATKSPPDARSPGPGPGPKQGVDGISGTLAQINSKNQVKTQKHNKKQHFFEATQIKQVVQGNLSLQAN